MAPQTSATIKTGTEYAPDAGSDFDLDIEILASAPVVAGLLNDTGDGCTSTCQSACSNSTCIGG
ncbi:FxLD family lanthipeptide [Streptomyces sp. DSM 44917]|uniref:FxLD family lanthipeptide n=1 Tax=Streptomyces boetiae TaxID=3075541 RepID=A0ABU2L700_9ACTN|nr:FxLD family lanthipeptide [Streptomyces sp. DSM 44917]MDT0307341.1 FxLD family lanthipeptide [Streptomyces sp. DSM 44917]